MRSAAFGCTLATIVGCTHPIEVDGEGDILATQPNRNCSFEQGRCDVVVTADSDYNEAYVALPREGHSFSHWEGCDYAGLEDLIGSGGGNTCSLSVPAAAIESNSGNTAPTSRAVFLPVSDSPVLPEALYNYADVELPEHYLNNAFPGNVTFQSAAIEHDNTPQDNPITDAGATLGRVLFYDRKLSASGNTACASCHRQEFGFDDPTRFSIGHGGEETRRHSMGLTNARFNTRGRFFWDERAETLEAQVLMPFQDEVEMGMTLEEVVDTVQAQPYYGPLFSDAFGDATVSADRIALALAQFVRSLVSFDAKYDRGRVQVANALRAFPNFTDAENRGKDVFFVPRDNGGNCAGCHASEAFVNVIPAVQPPGDGTHALNNGMDAISTDDLGVQEASGRAGDQGKFRFPSLRNIGVRAPHGHDGRFADLDAVMDFYSTGIQDHPNLAGALRDGQGDVRHFNLTVQEKSDLIAFLHTLTDEQFLTDEKFSDPFISF